MPEVPDVPSRIHRSVAADPAGRPAGSARRPGRRPSGRGRTSCRRSGSCSGPGSAAWPTSSTDAGRDPVRGAARLAGGDGPGPRGPTAPRPPRRPAGGHAPGPVPPVRGQRSRASSSSRSSCSGRSGRSGRGPDQRRRRARSGLRAGDPDGDARPHQPDRPEPADRTERRRARRAVPGPDRGLEPAAARPAPRGRRRPRAWRSPRASTSAWSGPTTRRRPRSGCWPALGGHAVGMSTVLECIAARWVGLEVCGVSLVTNPGAGYTRRAADARGGPGRRGGGRTAPRPGDPPVRDGSHGRPRD